MSVEPNGPPGSHPHADRPNWHQAENFDDYRRNCAEGLEQWSERRVAKLLGMTRASLWPAQLMAATPKELFERLMALKPRPARKELELVGRIFRGDDNPAVEIERCPHCGKMIRHRGLKPATIKAIEDWERSRPAAGQQHEPEQSKS
jgi:hypothetical protein